MKIATSTTYILLFCFLYSSVTQAQMSTPRGILYGNEWIDYTKEYLKFEVSQDGIYQIKAGTLSANGFDISQPSKLQLWHNGVEIPLYISSGENAMASSDFIEFVGFKNTIALDTFLYDDWKKDLLNPNYGLFTDISSYYLVMSDQDSGNKRFALTNPDYNDNSIESLPYYRHQSITNFSSSFYKPQIGELKYSHFQPSEGYTTGLRNNVDAPISVNGFVSQGDAPTVRLYLANNNNFPIIKSIKWNNTEVALDSTGSGRTSKINFTLEADKFLNENNLNIKITNNFGLFGLASLEASYNRSFNFANLDFTIANVDSKKRKITSTGLESGITHIYDLQNLQAIKLGENGALIAESGAKLVFGKNATELTLPSKKKFKNITSTDASFLFLTSEKLYDGTTPGNPIDEYAAYRSSSQGGGFKTEILTTQEVYDQFGYGIPNHNWAFKNMSHYLKDHWPSLHYVLIVGKAREYQNVRTPALMANPVNASFMVPTFGTSPSDVLLFSPGRYVNSYFAIGRIAASNIDEVKIYLDKVKQHDIAINAPQEKDKLWLKNIVHLGGGADGGERSSIAWFLDRMSDTIQRGAFGGNVNTFYKTSSTSVQVANLEGIYKNISEGASIVTFFGHASIGTFEFSLDNPKNYANEGKYPFIFSLGCYSGNIHSPSKGISEDFLFAKDRGAIAFIASAGTAYLSTQGIYGSKFYSKLTSEFYNERLGDMFKQFGENEKDVFTTGEYTLYQQLTYHGDPAVKIHGFEQPDYTLDYERTIVGPGEIYADKDSFNFKFDILNLGRGMNEVVEVQVLQTGPALDTVYKKTFFFPAPLNKESYTIQIPIKGDIAGKNKLFIEIDPRNTVVEITDANNILKDNAGNTGIEFVILSNEVFPTFPKMFSIYNGEKPLELITSSVNSFAPNGRYKMQLDTSELFNTSDLKETVFESTSPFMVWKPNVELIPNKVYYWRVCKIDEESQRAAWVVSNFLYLPGSPSGWNQSHYYQYLKNTNDIKVLNNNQFEYNDAIRNIVVQNGLTSFGTGELIGYSVDFSTYAASVKPWEYVKEGIAIAILDTVRGSHTANAGGEFGSISSGAAGAGRSFGFNTKTPEDRQKIVKFMEENIPSGYNVSFMTILQNADARIYVEEWANDTLIYGNSINNVLKAQGSSLIDLLVERGDVPYTFMFKKDVKVYDERVAESKIEIISTKMEFPYRSTLGKFYTPKIGPVAKWKSITTDIISAPSNNVMLSVIGFNVSGKEDTLLTSIPKASFDISNIDEKIYPYIKIQITDENTVTRIPSTINSIKVIYENLPDIITQGLVAENVIDTLEQGKLISFNTSLYLIGDQPLENIQLKLEMKNDKNNSVIEVVRNIEKLNIGVNQLEKYILKTNDVSGNIRVDFIANENKSSLETDYSNNFGTFRTFIKKDKINPKLNVYQNNVELFQNDILPKNNTFKIILNDDNQFLSITDPNSIYCIIKNEGGQDVFKSELNPSVSFKSEIQNGKNVAFMEFQTDLEDGKYMIEVKGRDASGNESGDKPLQLNFEVVSKNSIKNIYNYPNPFSTQTQFVYTLTGNVPNKMVLQIFTLTGKVVKEIALSDLELPRLGNNLTQFTWDGRDDYGSLLANGTYLFRIVAYDSNNSSYSGKATKNDFGKLVIIR